MPTGSLRTWYERHFPINPFPPNPPVNPLTLTHGHRRSCVYHMLEASVRSWKECAPPRSQSSLQTNENLSLYLYTSVL